MKHGEASGTATSLHETADPRILRPLGTAKGLCPDRRSGFLCLKEGGSPGHQSPGKSRRP